MARQWYPELILGHFEKAARRHTEGKQRRVALALASAVFQDIIERRTGKTTTHSEPDERRETYDAICKCIDELARGVYKDDDEWTLSVVWRVLSAPKEK